MSTLLVEKVIEGIAPVTLIKCVKMGDGTEKTLEDKLNEMNTNSYISYWSGKNINVIGDSIANGMGSTKEWKSYIKDYTGANAIRNYGVNGSTISEYANAQPIYTRYLNMDDNAQLVLMWAGTNDCGYGIPMGSINDNIGTTFYGALNITLEGLINKYPNSAIGVILPMQRADILAHNNNLKNYNKAIIEVCNKYSIPYFDAYNNLNICFPVTIHKTNYSYQQDGLHPNDLAQPIIARKIKSWIETL